MSDWLQSVNDKINALEAGSVNPVEPEPPIPVPEDWHVYVDDRVTALSEVMTPGETESVDIATVTPPGDWTSYVHGRLSVLEEAAFTSEKATAIANLAPPYDEAAFVAGPAEPPPGQATTDTAEVPKAAKGKTVNTGSPPKG